MSRLLLRVGAATALLSILVPLAPASAETWTSRDARGDVHGYTYTDAASEDVCPTYTDLDAADDANDDITRLAVRHTRLAVIATVGFRDLDPASEQHLTLHLKGPDRGWSVDVDRSERRPGRFRTSFSLSREPTFPDPDAVDPDPPVCGGFASMSADVYCRGRSLSVDLDRDDIRVVVPRSCLHNPRWIRVGAGSSGFEYPEPPSDQASGYTFNGYYDFWDPEGTASTDWLPPFGPRLRVRDGVVS